MRKFNLLIWCLISILPAGCRYANKPKGKIKNQKITPIQALTLPGVNSEGPYLFAGKGILMINWTEWYQNKSKNILKMALFNPQTGKFGEARIIKPSKGLQMHAESMAKVGMTAKGILYAIYRKKSPDDHSRFGGKLYYTISKDTGKTWSDELLLVEDSAATSLSFFDLDLLPDGELGIIWLDNRKPIDSLHKGKTLFFAKTDGDKGFTGFKPIAGSTCECCRTDIYTDSKGRIHVAYRNIIEPDEPGFDGKADMEIRDMFYLFSADTGKTFTKPVRIGYDNWHVAGCPHTGPSLAYNGKVLAAVWFTGKPHAEGLYFAVKEDTMKGFYPKVSIATEGRHPQMIAQGKRFFAVYEEYYEKNGKGFYKIVLNEPDGFNFVDKRFAGNITGKMPGKTTEISMPETRNNHPAIALTPHNKKLVAWVNTDTRNPKIMYRLCY